MAASLPRRHEALHSVGELDQADLVIVADGRERDHRGQFGGHLALLLSLRAELIAAAAIHRQQHGQLALFDKALDEGMAHARGHVPVDGANVVAGLVRAHVLEGNARAFENAVIFAAQQVLDGAARLQLKPAYLADDFAWQHGPMLGLRCQVASVAA